MQLLICPGYHSARLTVSFVRCLQRRVSPRQLWVLSLGEAGNALPWLLNSSQGPCQNQVLKIIGFSAGVVAAYPLALAWHCRGGQVRLIAMDGWGMPLMGGFPVYRMSHDRWTHDTTYLPSPRESHGYFYAEPAVSHLDFWQSPQATVGTGSLDGLVQGMTALDFIAAALTC